VPEVGRSPLPYRETPILLRVTEVGNPPFQLRKGEEGLSVFNPAAVDPPLTDQEVLEVFRSGSELLTLGAHKE
jgi:hypothetical protein